MSFPAYPNYRDSGVDWLGDVPSHWDALKVKGFAQFSGGGTPNREKPEYWNGDIPWVSPKDMKQEVITSSEEQITVEGLGSSATSEIEPGAVLLVVRSGILRHTIPVAINGVSVALNQDMKALRLNPSLCAPRFLFRWVQGLNDQLLLAWSKQGATVESIEHQYLAETLIPLPSLPEQTAIAAFLDRETAKIDALVEQQRRLVELLKQKRQAVISHAVTKGLDPTVAMKDSGVEWLGHVPAHWRMAPVRSLFRFVKRQDCAQLEVLSVYRDYGVIKKSDRGDNINKTPEDLSAYQTVNVGDLVINKMKSWQGSLGVSALQGIVSPDYAVFTPLHSGSASYFNHLFRCQLFPPVYRSISNGIRPDQWRLEPARFKELIIPVPPADEQSEIGKYLSHATEELDELITVAESSTALLNERRLAVISAAVTGKIDVRGAVAWQLDTAAA